MELIFHLEDFGELFRITGNPPDGAIPFLTSRILRNSSINKNYYYFVGAVLPQKWMIRDLEAEAKVTHVEGHYNITNTVETKVETEEHETVVHSS